MHTLVHVNVKILELIATNIVKDNDYAGFTLAAITGAEET